MYVRDGMSCTVVTVGSAHTLRESAAKMAAHGTGAAVVVDPDGEGPNVVTEHDIVASLARGQDPDRERVVDHIADQITHADPRWSLELAASVMVRSGRRHVVDCDGGEVVGVLSMRDIVRCWISDGANCGLAGLEAGLGRNRGMQTSPPSNPAVDRAMVDERESLLNSVMGF